MSCLITAAAAPTLPVFIFGLTVTRPDSGSNGSVENKTSSSGMPKNWITKFSASLYLKLSDLYFDSIGINIFGVNGINLNRVEF